MGYSVDIAYNGEAALELVSRNQYDLALLDYQMPGMDGVELFERIREQEPDIRGVFLTAYTRIDTVFSAIDAGAFRVLSKPVDFNELLPILEELVGRPAAS
jgi:CheY-like chemotaxis protein